MLPLRYAPWWRTASILLLILVLAAAVMPAVWLWPDRDALFSWFEGIDKSAHAIVFAFLALWFAGQYRPRSYWRIGLGLLMFGLLIELCQRMLSYRSAEWLDVAADVAGIIVGLLLAAAGLGGWCQRVEARYQTERDSCD
jgi:VanZ family protein